MRIRQSTIHKVAKSPDDFYEDNVQKSIVTTAERNVNVFKESSSRLEKIRNSSVEAASSVQKQLPKRDFLKKSNQQLTKSFRLLQQWAYQKKYSIDPKPNLHRGPQFVTKRLIDLPLPPPQVEKIKYTSVDNTVDASSQIISNQGIVEERSGRYKIHKHRKLVAQADAKNY